MPRNINFGVITCARVAKALAPPSSNDGHAPPHKKARGQRCVQAKL